MKTIERSKLVAVAVAATLTLAGGTAAVAATDDSPTGKGRGAEQREQRREDAKKRNQAAFAKALGVSVADVERARGEVRDDARERRTEREAERAKKQGVTVEQLRDRRADRVAKRLADRVDAGRLKQEQADRLVALVREGKALPAARKALRAEQRGKRLP